MRRTPVVLAIVLALAAIGAACRPQPPTPPPTEVRTIVLNGQGNNLDAYTASSPFRHQRVITTRSQDPNGLDINAQICFFPQDAGKSVQRFIAGEDTGQPNPPQGWGIFEMRGRTVGTLQAREIAKLTPTYQGSADNAENYGCGFLSDGRVLTTDVGNQASGSGDGQLIVWFPPFDTGVGGVGQVRYCKIDTAIATAGGIAVDGNDNVYVASARPPTSGVWRYTGPFPTSDTAAGGCGRRDSTGAPLADSVHKSIFIPTAAPLLTPNAVVQRPGGGFYVSSVINGVIAQYDERGAYVRTVLQPPAGEVLGPKSYSTGTPLGIGVDRAGSIFYADIGVVIDGTNVGPGRNNGSVRKIEFRNGQPQPPVKLADGLAFPDGIGWFQPL